MLRIEDLHVDVDGKEILRGLDLWVPPGEVHAVMGPNGAGKSTLAYTLAGREGYIVTRGRILYRGHDLTRMAPEERAREGIFLAFQYPVEIPGVVNANFLKSAVNAVRRHRGKPELDAVDFLKLARQKLKRLSGCSIPAWPSSTRRIPASTSTRSRSSATASTHGAGLPAQLC